MPGAPRSASWRSYDLGFAAGNEAHPEAGEAFLTARGVGLRVDAAAFLRALGSRGYRLARVMKVFVRDLDVPLPELPPELPGVRKVDPATCLGVLPNATPPTVLGVISKRCDISFWSAQSNASGCDILRAGFRLVMTRLLFER